MLIYTIRSGDTVWELGQRFGVSVSRIVQANDMPDPGQLVVGQALVIPTGNRYHTVRPGETLWEIARNYSTTVEAIARANQIQHPALIFPGRTLLIPAGSKPMIEANGYLTTMGEGGAGRVREVGESLTYVTPFSYHIKSDGTLTSLNDSAVIQAANSENVAPLMVITNFTADGFSSDLAHTILSNSDLQASLLTNILRIMEQKGYTGLNIDFEYVYPQDRENYNQFLRRAVERLHPEGYSVSTALAPKHSGTQQGLLYEAHDYPAHGNIADFVILMTYEWGWAGGPPLAISPIPEMRKVLDYAVTVIPRNKIMMGVSTYGRDWPLPYVAGETIARTISEQEAVNLAANHHVAIQYNSTYEAPHFRYTDGEGKRREVWYEDARSIQAKYNLVKEYNLRGVSYWVLDNRLPQAWLLQDEDFRIKKY